MIAGGLLAGLATAQAQPETGRPSESFLNALTAFDQAWTTSGLAFTAAIFTSGAATGYGQYVPRDNTVFSPEDTLAVYAEPVGYAFRESGSGFAYELTASYRLLTLSGQVLAEQDNFATFSGNGRTKQRELSATLVYQFSGLPAGSYELETVFTDDIGGTTSSFRLPFTVTAGN
ncbi:MAG: hypothetical protein Tsb0019_11860 [Roseibium sp.]